jgi:hypothetical protein
MSVPTRASHQAAEKPVRARIRWFSFAQGGRRRLPSVSLYRSAVRFDADPNRTLGTWDIELRFDRPPAVGAESTAIVSFRSNDAPRELLRPGSAFELTEGKKVVARGEVVGAKPSARVGSSLSAAV